MLTNRPQLSQLPPSEVQDILGSINFESVIESWKQCREHFPNATLEGYIDGKRVDIHQDELTSYKVLNKSFRLTNVQLYCPAVKKFCTDFFNQTNKVMTANLYFTPHSDAQCFIWHTDSQYSSTYQIKGEKLWSFLQDENGFVQEFYEQDHILNNFKKGKLKADEIEFLLKKGNWLEFPYCLLHRAQNLGTEPSVHITFAYNKPTWGDFAKFAFEKITGKPVRDNYLERVSIEEVRTALKKSDLNHAIIIKEFKEYYQRIEEVKKNEGRPYGDEL